MKNKRLSRTSRHVPFEPGDIIELVEPLAFIPAGRYVFGGLTGKIVNLRIGDCFLGTHVDFLKYFGKVDLRINRFDEDREFEKYLVRQCALLAELEQLPAELIEGATVRQIPALS